MERGSDPVCISGTFPHLGVKAGHQPIIIRPREGSVEVWDEGDAPVGWREDVSFTEYEKQIEPGTRIFLFSDGIVEAKGDVKGKFFGLQNLVELIADKDCLDLDSCMENISAGFRKWLDRREPEDDITMLAIEVN